MIIQNQPSLFLRCTIFHFVLIIVHIHRCEALIVGKVAEHIRICWIGGIAEISSQKFQIADSICIFATANLNRMISLMFIIFFIKNF
jgi:hypothetical protein